MFKAVGRACSPGAGRIRSRGQTMQDGTVQVPKVGLLFQVCGRPWPYHARAIVLLHQPSSSECSRSPRDSA